LRNCRGLTANPIRDLKVDQVCPLSDIALNPPDSSGQAPKGSLKLKSSLIFNEFPFKSRGKEVISMCVKAKINTTTST
jgi:hypothetical protein